VLRVGLVRCLSVTAEFRFEALATPNRIALEAGMRVLAALVVVDRPHFPADC